MTLPPSNKPEIPIRARQAMRNAITGTCFKALTLMSFSNGLMLVFLNAMGFDGPTVLRLISLVNVSQALSLIPSAHLADCFGKRIVTFSGIGLCGLGFSLLLIADTVTTPTATGILAAGISLYGIGVGAQVAAWYALLSPLVPPFHRGRFFGALRMSWQLCALMLGVLIAALLPRETSLPILKGVVFAVGLSILPWAYFYFKIPELERESCTTRKLLTDLKGLVRFPGYLPFCAYLFIIMLFVGGGPLLFGMIEKKTMALDDGTVILLANITMLGSVIGYYAGGKAVDKLGTKPIFLVSHFGYSAALVLFVIRDSLPVPIFPALAAAHGLYGLVFAASSVAMSTEMLALIPPERKSLTTSICSTMTSAGGALSGLLGAWAIDGGIFATHWTLCGASRSAYDAVLTIYAIMIVLMTVTLGLVPSVLGSPGRHDGPTSP